MQFEPPFVITNCIIDICKDSNFDLTKLFKEIIALQIPFLQIRASYDCTKLQLEQLLSFLPIFNDSTINEIFLLLPYFIEIDNQIKNCIITEKYFTLLFYGTHHSTQEQRAYNNVNINYTNNLIKILTSCGVTKVDNFIIQEDFYRESLKLNTCLNRKISIDKNGEIKNCPSKLKSYGNIKNTTLEEAINKQGFKDLWDIKKDDINICKDCEFRHICTDCRAYLQNPKDIYSKPLKCGYNPYTNKWEDWATNPLSKIGIKHYGLHQIIEK